MKIKYFLCLFLPILTTTFLFSINPPRILAKGMPIYDPEKKNLIGKIDIELQDPAETIVYKLYSPNDQLLASAIYNNNQLKPSRRSYRLTTKDKLMVQDLEAYIQKNKPHETLLHPPTKVSSSDFTTLPSPGLSWFARMRSFFTRKSALSPLMTAAFNTLNYSLQWNLSIITKPVAKFIAHNFFDAFLNQKEIQREYLIAFEQKASFKAQVAIMTHLIQIIEQFPHLNTHNFPLLEQGFGQLWKIVEEAAEKESSEDLINDLRKRHEEMSIKNI